MKKLLFLLLLPFSGWAQQEPVPVPKDPTNTPIYGGIGIPSLYEPALQSVTYQAIATLPNTGTNYYRPFRHIAVYNPSASRSVYLCFAAATASSCSTDSMKVPPLMGLALDHVYYGRPMDNPQIFGRLDGPGPVTAAVHAW